MSREDGFSVMDVSVDIVNDPKIRKLYRDAPDHAGAGFVAYVATMGESWKAGHRVSIEDSWPSFLLFDQGAIDALIQVRLLESNGFVTYRAWKSWFTPAQTRREAVRERWRRANDKRANPSTNDSAATASHNGGDRDETALSPRGSRAVTGAIRSAPIRSDSVPLNQREIPPPPTSGGRRTKGTNPRTNGASPRQRSTNPRATGSSTRQVRDDQKRGPTQLGEVLRKATATAAEPNGEAIDAEWMGDR